MKRVLIFTIAFFLISVCALAQSSPPAETCYVTSGASTNATLCKAAPGTVYAIHVTNTTSTVYYLRTYNLAATPDCSSTTGFKETIPATTTGPNGRITTFGQRYSTGIGFCITGGGASNDNTNAATGVYVTILYR